MSLACADPTTSISLAHDLALRNLAANREAIAQAGWDLIVNDPLRSAEDEWVFGRDRSLTFRDANGAWFIGCSLPRRAAAEMMRKLEITGQVACFLAPSHGAQLRVALDRLRPEQAIIAIIPDASAIGPLLACEDLSRDIAAHRLWIASGEDWPLRLAKLFDDQPGLCTPTQFIRLPVADEAVVEAIIPAAQKIFADANASRAAAIHRLRESYVRSHRRVCVLARSQFRLWEDGGATLAGLLSPLDPLTIDLDDPACSATMALARQAHDCGAIITADIARSHLPGVLSDALPWITWASNSQIPSAQFAAAGDWLITADPKLAIASGWRREQVIHAVWPDQSSQTGDLKNSQNALAMIVDTTPIDAPDHLKDFSSHQVLWEMIAADLRDNPFILTGDIESFLTGRMRKLDIAPDTVPASRFIAELILPAYQQSLARLLIRNKIPLRIFGKGWDCIPEFAALSGGAITTRQQFRGACDEHVGLVFAWPGNSPHAIDSMGQPVLRPRGSHGTSFISDAKAIVTGRAISALPSAPSLTCEMIQTLITQ